MINATADVKDIILDNCSISELFSSSTSPPKEYKTPK
jgi:hypothetical protein